ncbi:MAG: carbohydrate kinase family protein [Candidatus Thermoplasmatota archaeon]|nr:carbohydrate kinase family protein [Candidatus Thermoplasmatota archaeon]
METYLAVFGHTAIDVILNVPKLPDRDSSIAVEERATRFGGTAANIARASAEIDVDVSLCSFVGGDFPDDYLDALVDSGVSTDGLKVKKDHDTTTCWIINDREGEQLTIVDQGAMKEMQDFEIPTETIEDCEVLHIGTGKPSYYRKIYDRCDLEKKSVGFDPAQELEYMYDASTFEKFLRQSDFFFCNQKEKEVALRYLEIDSFETLLDDFGLDFILVTKGGEGSTLHLPEEKIIIPTYEPQKIVEPTGAGDAFRAGFYAALSRDLSLERACRAGSARASFAVEKAGSQTGRIGWKDVIFRMEEQST